MDENDGRHVAKDGRERQRQIKLRFCVTELETAFAYLELARVTTNKRTRERNVANAEKALAVARTLKKKLKLRDGDQAFIDGLEERVASCLRDLAGHHH